MEINTSRLTMMLASVGLVDTSKLNSRMVEESRAQRLAEAKKIVKGMSPEAVGYCKKYLELENLQFEMESDRVGKAKHLNGQRELVLEASRVLGVDPFRFPETMFPTEMVKKVIAEMEV